MKYVVLCLCVFMVACSEKSDSHSHANDLDHDHTHDEQANIEKEEKAIKHIEVPKITSEDEARRVFFEETAKIDAIENFDETDLHQLHLITYSLEQSVFFFVENLTGAQQESAKEIAVVVEEIHLNSERGRRSETKAYVVEYLKLAGGFISGL